MKQKEIRHGETADARWETVNDLLYLCGCAVNDSIPDSKRAGKMDLAALYRIAERHMLTSIAAYALETAGITDHAFKQARAMAIRKTAIMDDETAKVLERLETAGIWYMPMKGAILKDLYPVYGMRQMSDRDIFVDADRMDEIREIMENLGYTVEAFHKDYHDCYVKQPVSRFEMHRRLIGPMSGKTIYSYYLDGKSRLQKDDQNACGWHFSPEDFYVFMVAHEYKHFSAAGTGLRSILDIYVYLKNTRINQEYVAAETAKLGIDSFERANRELAQHLFGGEKLTEKDAAILDYVLSSGTYGKEENRAKNQIAEKGRMGYFLSRLTLPYARMEEIYPVLKKMPALYPFCWTHRLVHAFLFKNKRVMNQLKAGMARKKDN